MRKTIQRIFILILTAVLFTGIGMCALAAGGAQSGSCGVNATYTLKDGVLTISGTGWIDDRAFYDNRDIRKLVIGEGITHVGDYAFYNCISLSSVSLPESMTGLGEYSFHRCLSLHEIVIPAGVEVIQKDAFSNCEDLHITFLGKPKYPFDSEAFCYSTITATVPDDWTEREMLGYWASSITYLGGWMRNGDIQISQREPGVWTIHGNGSIAEGAFRDRNDLCRVTVENGVTGIGSKAFENCGELTSVTLPSSVTAIGDSAFVGCAKLSEVSAPDGLEKIGSSAFQGCSLLREFPFGTQLSELGENVFEESGLRKIDLPGTLLTVPESAFSWCKDLKEVIIRDGTEHIGGFAFYQSGLTSVTLPDSITSIGECAFQADLFASFRFPAQLETIGERAFYGCKNLRSTEFGNRLRTIGSHAFEACSSLASVKLNEGLQKLGSSAFSNCPMKTLILPETLTSIGSGCFLACENVETLRIPDSVTELGESALESMTSLRSVKLSAGLTVLRNYMFRNCTSLKELTIPANVTVIGVGMFSGTPNLKQITCLAEEPPETKSNTFYKSSVKTVNVPVRSTMAYGNANRWNSLEIIGLMNSETLTPASDGSYHISDEEELAVFLRSVANGNSYAGKTVLLTNDIDCSRLLLSAIWPDAQRKSAFRGCFDGQGHTLSSLTMVSHVHHTGLFRTLGDGAVIENLNLDEVSMTADASADCCAALAGYADGTVTISGVSVLRGTVSGGGYIAGVLGEYGGSSTLTMENCVNGAEVTASGDDAAGILAHSGAKKGVTLKQCENSGTVFSASGHAGGIAGYLGNNNDDGAHTVQGCVNFGAVSTGGNAGGIIGGVRSDSRSHVIFSNENNGSVTATGSGSYAGGIIGYHEGGGIIADNRNTGAILSQGREAGGIVAALEDDSTEFDSDTNTGSVSGVLRAGGVIGYVGDNDHDEAFQFTNCSNTGSVVSETSDAGGIIGGLCTDSRKHVLAGNKNSGDISGAKSVGGLIGWSEGGGSMTDNSSTGNITSTGESGKAGGLIGHVEDDPWSYQNCTSSGALHGSKTGSVCGWDGYQKKSVGTSGGMTSSVFSGGSLPVIVGCACLLLGFAGGFLLGRKQKAAGTTGDSSETEEEENLR